MSAIVDPFLNPVPAHARRSDPAMRYAVARLWAMGVLTLAIRAPEDPAFVVAAAAFVTVKDGEAVSRWFSHLLLTSSVINEEPAASTQKRHKHLNLLDVKWEVVFMRARVAFPVGEGAAGIDLGLKSVS
jgi:hypothetical protein